MALNKDNEVHMFLQMKVKKINENEELRGHSLPKTGKSYWTGRLNTIDLLILTSLDHLLFLLKIVTFLSKKLP
jgi:hypothetical protein